MVKFNVLVACEESQAVCNEIRKLGHNAYSCDIIETSGNHKEWHIKNDVIPLLDGKTEFVTSDGTHHIIDGKWDLIVAFPPCTNLCVSGARWFEKKREDGSQLESIKFFEKILNSDCDHIAVENPINIIGGEYIKKWFPSFGHLPSCNQVIQPWMFGHGETKATCLWIKNLPLLTPTNIVEGREHRIHKMSPSADRGKLRSKTYLGIAQAMANQWIKYLERTQNED